jgi:hypothetical protein
MGGQHDLEKWVANMTPSPMKWGRVGEGVDDLRNDSVRELSWEVLSP